MKIQKCLGPPGGEFWREYCPLWSFMHSCPVSGQHVRLVYPCIAWAPGTGWPREGVTLNKEVLCSFDLEGAGRWGHITHSWTACPSMKGHLRSETQCL